MTKVNESPKSEVTAAVIVIGNEVLSGRTKDANLPFLAERLNQLGIRLREARIVADVEDAIAEAVNQCRDRFDYVFTTGGIGPTHDDITAACVAKAFGAPLIQNPEAVAILEQHYENTDHELNEARLRMANTPQGAELLVNPVSRAPGFRMDNVYVMAGVPRIMQAMFDGFKYTLRGGVVMLSRAVACDVGEGNMAAGLTEIQNDYPNIDVGSYPFFKAGGFGTTIVLRGPDAAELDAAAERVRALMRGLGGDPHDAPT